MGKPLSKLVYIWIFICFGVQYYIIYDYNVSHHISIKWYEYLYIYKYAFFSPFFKERFGAIIGMYMVMGIGVLIIEAFKGKDKD